MLNRPVGFLALAISSCLLFFSICAAQSAPQQKPKTHFARGSFEVRVAPLKLAEQSDPKLGRMSIEKQFHGELEGTSVGEMLTAGTPSQRSAGYVAIEKVTGTLNGKHGTFVLQHDATIDHGKPELKITVVPESGTAELQGIAGAMKIIIVNDKHSYEFEYTLPGD